MPIILIIAIILVVGSAWVLLSGGKKTDPSETNAQPDSACLTPNPVRVPGISGISKMKRIWMVFVAFIFISFCQFWLNESTHYYSNIPLEISHATVLLLAGQSEELMYFKSFLVWLFVFPVFYCFVSYKSRNSKLPIGIKLVATIDLVTGCVGVIFALFWIIRLNDITVHPEPFAGFWLLVAVPSLVVSSIVGFLGITTWKGISALDSKSAMLNLAFFAPAWTAIALILHGPISVIYFFFGLSLVFVLNMPSVKQLFKFTA